MRIIEEEQLDFSDVLIMPRRSELMSRSDVDIVREFHYNKFLDSSRQISGIPVCCANMAPVATPTMAKIFAHNKFFCALEKHLDADTINSLQWELVEDAVHDGWDAKEYVQRVFPSIGLKEPLDNLKRLSSLTFGSEYTHGINIDVPNGYVPHLIDRVKEVRRLFKNAFIVAGTVVTPDICQDLINAGANAVRVGIGSGAQCFVGDTLVKTKFGDKKIRDILIGDEVLTHTGQYQPVVNKFEFNDNDKVMDVNGITCTPNHPFAVVFKEDVEKITEENFSQYIRWVEAKDLDPKRCVLVSIDD